MNAALQNHGKTGRNTARAIAMGNGSYGTTDAPRDESLDWDSPNGLNVQASRNALTPEMAAEQEARCSSRKLFI